MKNGWPAHAMLSISQILPEPHATTLSLMENELSPKFRVRASRYGKLEPLGMERKLLEGSER